MRPGLALPTKGPRPAGRTSRTWRGGGDVREKPQAESVPILPGRDPRPSENLPPLPKQAGMVAGLQARVLGPPSLRGLSVVREIGERGGLESGLGSYGARLVLRRRSHVERATRAKPERGDHQQGVPAEPDRGARGPKRLGSHLGVLRRAGRGRLRPGRSLGGGGAPLEDPARGPAPTPSFRTTLESTASRRSARTVSRRRTS